MTPTGREIFCDTTPLLYLHRIDRLDLLRDWFRGVVVPRAVEAELAEIRRRGKRAPDLGEFPWISVRSVDPSSCQSMPPGLGPGECDVLTLGLMSRGSLLVMDDARAREHASSVGLQVVGTLGVLVRAKREGLVTALTPLIDRLQQEGFWLDPRTEREILALVGE